MNPHQKPKTVRDPKYLKWVRKQPCVICQMTFPRAEAHHTETGGMGMKGSDYATVPLCRFCHDVHDRMGKETFWVGWNLKSIIEKLRRRYEATHAKILRSNKKK